MPAQALQGCGGAQPGPTWDTPAAGRAISPEASLRGRGHQEANGILYTLCWSNLPVNAFWAPPSRLLIDKEDPFRAHEWSRMTWMQWLTAMKSAGIESGPTEMSVAKATLGLQRPATHICPALPWAQGPSTFWDMLHLLTQAAAFQLVPPMLLSRAMWSQVCSSKTTNFRHETSDTEMNIWTAPLVEKFAEVTYSVMWFSLEHYIGI